MALHVEAVEQDGVTIFRLTGRLVLGDDSTKLQETLTTFALGKSPSAILDLKHTSFIDSSGLGVLVSAYSACKRNGGALKLLHVRERSLQLLLLTKLNTVFEVFDEQQTAINSFFENRTPKEFDILRFLESEERDG